VGQGFSVRTDGLRAGSQDMAALQGRCQIIAEYVVATLTAMAGSAGHPGLASALTGATRRENRAFTDMLAAYGHASNGLAASAQNYADTDQAIAGEARRAGRFLRGPGWPG
jgi:uncharacterized protein YukE